MNLNPLPVAVKVVKPCTVAGRGYQPGEIIQVAWIHCKHLERHGMAERMVEITENTEPLRDVLIFTPVLRLEPETVRALMALKWDGALSMLLQMDNPTGKPREDHLHQYQRGREAFLAGPYDAMLVIESDIIPPEDTLIRLAALQADCAYGVYRFQSSTVINIFELYPTIPRPHNTGESLSLKPYLLMRAIRDGKIPCSGAGLGCILIRRKVLEAIDFRTDGTSYCDTPFNEDVLHAGFSQMADMLLVCGHKTRKGEIVWPQYPSQS